MNKQIKLYFLLMISTLLAACEGNDIEIEKMIKDKTNPIKYVIEGQISNMAKKQYVFITRAGAISGDTQYAGISNAEVSISDGQQQWLFKELAADHEAYQNLYLTNRPYLMGGGLYESVEYFAGIEGNTYTLTVRIEGETYVAQETMPMALPMSVMEFSNLQHTSKLSRYLFGQETPAIWTSSAASTSAFALMGRESIKTLLTGRITSFHRYHTDAFDAHEEESHILHNDNSTAYFNTLRRYTPSQAYADYMWANVMGRGGSAFAIEQNPLPSNFNTPKVAGFFSAISYREYDANEQIYEENVISYLIEAKEYRAHYDGQGVFKLHLNANGGCVLEGMGESLEGAYDIYKQAQIRVYFPRRYAQAYEGLYHFYEVILKKALPFPQEEPDDIISYWSGENALFEIQPNGSLKAQDGSLWQ